MEGIVCKASTTANQLTEKLGTSAPLQIGTRGTVGSLLLQEIEYFSRLETDPRKDPKKQEGKIADFASKKGRPERSKWRKKKKFLPSLCKMAEVAENTRPIVISKFSYRNLKTDAKAMQG
ncbi:hypothetical protein Syun_010127 [Stephania yunnanensis]|uniref:Uncharacterized protein n=1 Tax=Stephania yunnanensis TaxID=152371 RepID=A0AAP0KHJ3_9MAGN